MTTQYAISMDLATTSHAPVHAHAFGNPSRKPWHTSVLALAGRSMFNAIALAPDSAPPGMISA